MSTHEENLSQPWQTNNKQFKNAVNFLTGYNGFFIVTNKNTKIYFATLITDDGLIQTNIPRKAFKLERLNKERKQYH